VIVTDGEVARLQSVPLRTRLVPITMSYKGRDARLVPVWIRLIAAQSPTKKAGLYFAKGKRGGREGGPSSEGAGRRARGS
jgi:hypothetical protein